MCYVSSSGCDEGFISCLLRLSDGSSKTVENCSQKPSIYIQPDSHCSKRKQNGEMESGEQEGERKTGRKQNESQPSLSSTCFPGACSLT